MFKKILTSILLLTGLATAQFNSAYWWQARAGSPTNIQNVTYWTFTAITGTNLETASDWFIYGAMSREAVSASTGSTNAAPYMRWWGDVSDSTGGLQKNGTFDTGLDGWSVTAAAGGDTIEWSANYGGSMRFVSTFPSNSLWLRQDAGLPSEGTHRYRVQYDVLYSDSGNVSLPFGENNGSGYGFGWTGHIDTLMYSSSAQEIVLINNLSSMAYGGIDTVWSSEVYIDNIQITPAIDSARTFAKPLSLLAGHGNDYLIEDLTYYYDCVTIPAGGNDVYSDGEDSSFTTALAAPVLLNIIAGIDTITLSYLANTTRNGNGIGVERDTSGGSSWVRIDTTDFDSNYYIDGTVLSGGSYKYRKINLGYNNESAYSNTLEAATTGYEFTFSPSTVNIVTDSIAAGGGSEEGELFAEDFEDGNLDNFVSTMEAGNTGTIESDSVNSGSYALKMAFTGSNNLGYLTAGLTGATATTIYFRCYYNIDGDFYTHQASTFQVFDFFAGTDDALSGSNNDEVSMARLKGDGDRIFYKWNLRSGISGIGEDDGDNNDGDEQNTWKRFEMGWGKGTGANGWFTIRIDGDSVAGKVGLDFITVNAYIDSIRIGNFDESGNPTGTFYIDDIVVDTTDWVGVYVAPAGGGADTSITVAMINNSGVALTLNDITNEALPFTVVSDSTLPETVANGDTLNITVTLDRDTSGIFDQTLDIELDIYSGQKYTIYANVRSEPPYVPPVDTTAPEAPTGLVATGYNSGGSTWINVSWIESTSSDKDSLRLFATPIDDIGGTFNELIILAELTTEYNDTTLTDGETRNYKIKQQDDSLNVSEFSNADSGLVPVGIVASPPNAPSLSAVGDTLAIHLTIDTTGCGALDSLRIYRNSVWIGSIATTAYTDTPLSNNTSYAHYVTAYSIANGESNASNITNTFTSDTTIEADSYCGAAIDGSRGSARDVTITYYPNGDSVVCTWSWNVDSSLVREIYFRKGETDFCCGNDVGHGICFDSLTVTSDIRATPRYKFQASFEVGVHDFKLRYRFSDGTVGDLSDYYTYNCSGCTIATDGVDSVYYYTVIIDTIAPDAPTDLVATGYYSGGSTWNNISWVESISLDKDSLRLYATAIDDPLGNKSWILSLPGGTTEYNDTTVGVNESRGYHITQLDLSFNESATSNSDSGLVPSSQTVPPPNAPSNLAGTPDTLAIGIIFNQNSTDEDSFFVYINGVKDTSLAPNDTAYTQYGLANNTSYEFKVSAWNSAGGESNFSNIINTTTSDTTTFAFDIFYVDKNASGGNNGTSWANGWQSFSAINWGLIGEGDILYISGGVYGDTVTYYETLSIQSTGTTANLITIRAGLDVGHNGTVMIDAENIRASAISVAGTNTQGYLRIIKFTCKRSSGQGTIAIKSGAAGHHQDINEVYVDSCRITDVMGHAGVFINGNSASGQVPPSGTRSFSDSVFIRHTTIDFQDAHASVESGRDGIFVQSSRNIFVEGCTIINDNRVTYSHSDNIQIMYGERVFVWHSLFYLDAEDETNWERPNQVFMWESMMDTLVIYGNVFYAPLHRYITGDRYNDVLDKNNPYSKTYYFINNTAYTGDVTKLVALSTTTDAYFYNNVFNGGFGTNRASVRYTYPYGSYGGDWSLTDGNVYGHYLSGGMYGRTIAQMLSDGAESTGVLADRYSVNPLWINITYGTDDYPNQDFGLQSSSPAINVGVNVQSIIEGFNIPYTDIDGNSLDSTPDAGAYQYVP